MTFEKNHESDKSKSLKKLKNYVLLGTVIPVIGLTSCVKTLTPNVGNLNIFQPSTLRLEKSKPVPTLDGVYTPQENEVWHSDKRYRILEREVYND